MSGENLIDELIRNYGAFLKESCSGGYTTTSVIDQILTSCRAYIARYKSLGNQFNAGTIKNTLQGIESLLKVPRLLEGDIAIKERAQRDAADDGARGTVKEYKVYVKKAADVYAGNVGVEIMAIKEMITEIEGKSKANK
jgi:hypothetical protein